MKKEQPIKLEIFKPAQGNKTELPFFSTKISAGFPSPAEDFIEKKLDLNEYLIKNPSATFFIKVSGHSMKNAGIFDGDILVVDRSIEPSDNKIVIGVVNGEFTVKRLTKENNKLYLMPENPDFKPLEINESMDVSVWGVVTYTIHKTR
ncbi:MAG: translesion error-prone DNA polymerase V autoproteolytic subunit [Bacteroidales bacterium]|jgi:DNA polymerase V|nr:translesion error-prone DNA polymerase V autoproteolytic subunit [Bacteroidales bacterium]MDD4213316.1 translesion error-prone DNA polymerase V autoproteolytic subunit [Bacteroidales bacterium]